MKKNITDIIILVLLVILLVYVYDNRTEISNFVLKRYAVSESNPEYVPNEYAKDYSYNFIKKTYNFVPKNKEELKNSIYSILNNGWDNFSFFCDSNYLECEDDIKEMSENSTFNSINNFIHPYNSYKSMNITINNLDVITIKTVKNYSDSEIVELNNKISLIEKEIINDNMSVEDKILAFHDYIVNNTIYDSAEAALVNENITLDLNSYKAYNVLVNGIGLCGGYADTMAIFLNKLGVNNYKVSTETHVWNALNINNKWLHIDVTWDDPVTNNKIPKLLHDYYMIDTNKLYEMNDGKHIFNQNIYSEIKQA